MYSYVLRRIGVGVGLVLLVLTLIFLALHLVPGDPAMLLLSQGDGASATPEAVARVRAQLGLDEPLLTQYWQFLSGALTGDLGQSFRNGQEVSTAIGERLPRTLELVGLATLIAVVVGVPWGALAARKGGWFDSVTSVLTSIGVALPVFVFGSVLILVFSLRLGLLPAGGYAEWGVDPNRHTQILVLPAVALAVGFASTVARMTRSAVLEMLHQDWVRTARSLGLSRRAVFRRYVLRNSLTPVVTTVGIGVGTLLGSTVLVERVFNYPGLSSLLVESVTARDYPVVQGVVITIAVLFVSINILVDVLYGVLDPRVRR
ncbi:ABC transporter permease [Nocardioides zeae]|uniref:ABC transporter permease n=1 Tax=Nocardioides imazamoxiresistens TaxID=3231893 RepID=A0ABU3PW16_9ACTN|nr:ABC transporter permease [Nocardioides zeae]MDT9593022.1 ABC transporter permease [Nocardioides zeae]